MAAPKLFVSYSWTSPDHEAWVRDLATELRESGVDVTLDKWDLKEGQDANTFMERMVTDPEIKKVILICDKAYVEKADERRGGVGTEAQIISAEIYASQDQDKFVAVIKEHDEEGKPYRPVYYRSRIFIDLSDQATYAENFEQLVRWAYDQPLYKKPPLGEKPGYLTKEEGAVVLATASRFKRAVDALKNDRNYATAAVIEYLDTLSRQFEQLRVDSTARPFDDVVVQSIESFLPYRNEVVELFLTLALYRDTAEVRNALHHFFESLIPYMDHPEGAVQWTEWSFDNYRFIIHELFLYAVACLIQHERFVSAAHLMGNDFYVAGQSAYGRDVMVSFAVFRQFMETLRYRNERLGTRRLSLRADMLKERCKGLGIEFRHVMQADFILFIRSRLQTDDLWGHWWPETLLYVGRHVAPFEVFARSRSASYFERSKEVLGVRSKEELRPLLEIFNRGGQQIPRWESTSFDPAVLLGFDELATKP